MGEMQSFVHRFAAKNVRASSLLGAFVVNANGGIVGDIEDVVVDAETGNIEIAVLWCGGFLGTAEKLIAVPFAALQYNEKNNEYVLDVTRDWLTDAPGFDSDHWPAVSDVNWNHQVQNQFAACGRLE